MFNTLSARLASPVRWLMVAGIAYTVANSLMFLLAGPESAAGPASPTDSQARPARAAVDIEQLLARNLFGVAGAKPAANQGAASVAVATQLPLELRGVFVAEGEGTSAAIIAQRGRPGQLYDVGQEIAGSATLESVYQNHVILRRAGNAETLNFPQLSQGQNLSPTAPIDDPELPVETPYEEMPVEAEPYETIDDSAPEDPATGGVVNPDAPSGNALTAYRERLDRDPEGTLQSLGMSPVSAGSAAGYQVNSLAGAPYLSQTGLQPGDVILSVNGRPVGDLGRDRLEVENVLAQGSARIEVQRGSRRFFVTASLP